MLKVKKRQTGSDGVLWITELDIEKRRWLWMILPQLVALNVPNWPKRPFSGLQTHSDLELGNFPFYMGQVPSVFFFPYITYTVESWPTGAPVFVIPKPSLNRLDGRSWITTPTPPWFSLINPKFKELKQAWINPQSEPIEMGLSYLEAIRSSAAARIYLLDKVRYIYDETRSNLAGIQMSVPARYQFDEEVAEFTNTTVYLDWYLIAFNEFVDRFVTSIKSCTTLEERKRSLVIGWTVNRLAVDAFITMSVDIPYLRKWQFFGFLDALASLRNELNGLDHHQDKKTAQDMLSIRFLNTDLLPVLKRIPVKAIREAVIKHTKSIYDSIEQIKTQDYSGPEILWEYRNSRHGYTLKSTSREMLLLDEGIVPNNLPDLTIALWHYILLSLHL